MHARSLARLTPHVVLTLCSAALALCLPACDCAGNSGLNGTDAGDTGALSDTGPPRDGGPDGGARDGGPDTGAHDAGFDAPIQSDSGACSNPETCNGVDDDCDGTTDENIVVTCGSDIGICRSGTQTCSGGSLGACTGGMTAAAAETCGNGLDDDCDEAVDEACNCTDGATQNCGSGVGECRRGTQTCAANAWGACAGEVVPTAELCDGLDNNCDGQTDEIFAGLGGSCDGPDADRCAEGMTICSADHLSTSCDDATGDNVEMCNGVDDNCDGTVDEGCICTNGATQTCGVNMGACTTGTQTCASGAWGACVGGVGPTTEICNGIDDNCDGQTDEGFALGGVCDGPDSDFCPEGGMFVCDPSTGGIMCSDVSGDTLEVCNAVDDNCDGNTDEGFGLGAACDGPDTDMCNEGVIACNGVGGAACNDATGDSVEVCNGMDDDCDGNTDEGNPGGGVVCAGATDHGTCVSRTVCMGGALICRGTFVALSGSAGAPGSDVMPTSSITTAIANAVAIGGGVDVCVCDPLAAGASTFTENVTMVEGVSVLGGLDCATWALNGNVTTSVQDVDADGLTFPAGITVVTALDHMTVVGFNDATAGARTAAITITDASPTLSTDTVRAGGAAIADGLRVIQAAGIASPTISNGAYSAAGIAGGTAVAVSIEGASPHFTTVAINALSGAPAATTTSSYGVDCIGCAGTTFMGGQIFGGGATTTAYGLHGTGNLAGLALTTTAIIGGFTNGAGSTSTGVRLDTCTGAPTFTTVTSNGGANIGAVIAPMSTRTAFSSSGPACAPVIDGGRYVGCEAGVTCLGIDADTSSQIVVRNVNPGAGGAPVGIQGTTGAVDTSFGMRCRTSACASITNNTIAVGNLTRSGPTGVGLWIQGTSPAVDSNRITGPNGGIAVALGATAYYGVYLADTSSVVTNNVVHDGTHAQRVVSLLYDMTPSAIGLARGPIVANNTIDYVPCTGCGPRVGMAFFSNSPTLPSGTFRNNIVHNLAAGGMTNAVVEANVNSDPRVFENNALWDPTATGGAVYFDEAMTPLATAVQINALNGIPAMSTYGGNLVVDCLVNASFHIPMASMCVDTGTLMSCPALDFEAQSRPFPAACDIGADEFHP